MLDRNESIGCDLRRAQMWDKRIRAATLHCNIAATASLQRDFSRTTKESAQMYRTYGVFASVGRRLVARAKAIPLPMRDRGGFPQTPDREPLPAQA